MDKPRHRIGRDPKGIIFLCSIIVIIMERIRLLHNVGDDCKPL